MRERLVAVTGAGVVSPLGSTLEDFHRALIDARPGIRKLAALAPKRLALMHGSSYSGDGAAALNALADYYAASLTKALG